uniref:Uncharacterized protein n=1 Tax=Lepeophtheirus salmonis TaxID=72036 RepID=A0A0K2U1N6_LEPSM
MLNRCNTLLFTCSAMFMLRFERLLTTLVF